MKYVILNPQYALRHGENCSYMVKKHQLYDSSISPGANSFSIIPKYLGYVISLIGFTAYEEDIPLLLILTKKLSEYFLTN